MTSLRPADPADLPAMAEVFVAAWRGGYRGVVPDAVIDAWTPAAARAELAGGDGLDVVALDATGTVVGFARYQPDSGYLASLYVAPAAAGRGAGRALLRYALDAMPGHDVTLWVFEANARAQDLYTRAGFRPDGARLVDPRWQTPQVRLHRPAERTDPPYVDEHRATIAAPRELVWTALRRYAHSSLAAAEIRLLARLLGTEPPSGFEVTEEIPDTRLTLSGHHRFSRYRLVFELADVADGTTSVSARTYAAFPGPHGFVYRAMVISTRGHVVAVMHMLRTIRRMSLELARPHGE